MWALRYALLPCRVLQHVTIRKEEEELHTAIEAGLPDEDIGKLARISHRVRKCPLFFVVVPYEGNLKQIDADPQPQSGSRLDTGLERGWPQPVFALQGVDPEYYRPL